MKEKSAHYKTYHGKCPVTPKIVGVELYQGGERGNFPPGAIAW